MQREQIVFVGTSDMSGHFRGKSFPAADLPARLQRGVGLAPTNLFISAFGPIHTTPFGNQGEVLLIPDPETRVLVPFAGTAAEHFFIGNIVTLAGAAWSFCPRSVLARALERLGRETGLRLLATFEQEFTYSGAAAEPWLPYGLSTYRRQGFYGETLLAALRQARVVPDSFLGEYGRRQYEVTTKPAIGVRSADEAVITRELAQAVAFRCGERVSFTPLPEPAATSSGTHIHFSLLQADDQPALYAENAPWQISPVGRRFIAGILAHLPALCALTAPSVVSYYRMRPNRWAPLKTDVAALDRGSSLRICPVVGDDPLQRARQCNVEYRVADATASPYLALAGVVQAGLAGIRDALDVDAQMARPLPASLSAALDALEADAWAHEVLGGDLLEGYLAYKRAEIASLDGLDEAEICRRYAEVY
jgi:glutamine synthetase